VIKHNNQGLTEEQVFRSDVAPLQYIDTIFTLCLEVPQTSQLLLTDRMKPQLDIGMFLP